MSEVKGFIIFIAIVLGIVLMCNTVVFIKTGEIGIVTKFGAVEERVMTQGINFKIPFINGVKKMNCKTQKYDIESGSASKDMQDVQAKISVNYSVNVENASKLFREVGQDYLSIILEPTILDTIKSVTAEFTAEELITKRPDVSQRLLNRLQERMQSQGINIVEANITDLNFSESFNRAIEEKQVAEQNVKTEQQRLEQIKVQAEQKKVEAEGTAEANRILNESLSEENLQKLAIEKWNGQLPTTITDGTVPFLNVN